jgi:nicotinamide riboside kinase
MRALRSFFFKKLAVMPVSSAGESELAVHLDESLRAARPL